MSITPDRATVVTFDVDEVVLGLQSWTLQRRGLDIRPMKSAGELRTTKVFCAGGDAWLLLPQFHEAAQALKSTVGGFIEADQLQLAPGFVSFDMFRRRDDLPGIGAGASVVSAGAPAILKRVAASDDWDAAQLTLDTTSLPPPPADSDAIYPQDRIASGLTTYPANTPFMAILFTPEGFAGTDAFFTLYFGGETQTTPDGTSGGQFCVTLRGGGDAHLYEYDEVESEWVLRQDFRWNEPGASPGGVSKCLAVIPYAERRIWIAGNYATPYSSDGFALLGLMASSQLASLSKEPSSGNRTLYREALTETGHTHINYMTGEGTVRADLRRDLRTPLSLMRGVYPEEGTLIDSPFEVNRILPADTPIRVEVNKYQYPETDITVQLYNAADDTALSLDGDGAFLSVAGQRKYYAVFTFTTSDSLGTPVLYGYSIDISGFYLEREGSYLQTPCHSVSITGPDIEPTQDQASVEIQDATNALELLRTRDGIRTYVSLYTKSDNTLITHLFEGETCQSQAHLRGSAGDTYPSPDWYAYDLRLSGLYTRLEEQFHDAPPFSFASSKDSLHPQASAGGTDDGWDPWKVTDIIRWLLNHAGVRDDELDIPDYDLRLWPSPGLASDAYAVQPGTAYGKLAATLIKDILGAVLLRDPNAGTRGMWRVLAPPYLTSANYLWRFNLDAPPNPGRLATYPGAMGAATSFVQKETFSSYPKKPEGNVITVYGQTEEGGSGQGSGILQAQIVNFNSLLNPSSPDYLGRAVPITRGVDSFLVTQEACNWVAYRLYEQAARAQKWFEWVAPLVLVTDPVDLLQVRPRMLRINDLVYLHRDGVDIPVILRSVNPSWEKSDERQMAHYEGKLFE